MIPQRVKLKGFLCYKEEQSIAFEGNATLWMLSGLNGSGKSAIFDAVTYALFGHHRGGASGAVELINKDSDTLLVEFDFLLDGRPHRVKRTLKRDNKGGAKGTQVLFRNEDSKWAAVEGTEYKRQFDEWMDENLGLNYDTFTSSVLLLQGKAEKLLDSRPEGRREVLASIVDLGRYERLHQKADERRKALDGAVKALNGRIAALPAVDPLELGAARLRISDAEEARAAARGEVERWQSIETQARLWQNVQGQLHVARSRHKRSLEVLRESASIESAHARLCELRDVLPRLHEIVVNRGQAAQSSDNLGKLALEQERKKALRLEREAALRQSEEKRRTLQAQIDRDTAEHARVQSRLRDLSVQMATLAEVERNEDERGRVKADLAKLPARPEEDVAKHRDELERLEAVARLVPVLERFRKRRDELRHEQEAGRQAEETMQAARTRGEARKAEAERLKADVENAGQLLRNATANAAEARALADQARKSLDELSQLEGAKICRHCAQPLTPGHVEEQKKVRARETKKADEHAKKAALQLEQAKTTEADLKARHAAADEAYQAARDEWKTANAALGAAKAAVERSQRDIAAIHAELPPALAAKAARGPVKDWAVTKWPEPADVDAVKAEARGADAARRALRDAESALQKHAALKANEAAIDKTLARQRAGLPADRDGLRRDHSDHDAREKALFKAIDAGRAASAKSAQDAQKLEKERDAAVKDAEDVDRRIREQEMTRENALRNVATYAKALPDAWKPLADTVGMKEFAALRTERDSLESKGVEDEARELKLARSNLEEMARTVADLEKQDAAFPAEARHGLEEIARQTRAAKAADDERERGLSEARQQLMLLESYEKQRAEVRTELLAQEGELLHYRLLAELLGRDKLQLYLVRQAERQVVEFANSVLDRLSGGTMYMKLSGEACGEGGTGKALELEVYNRATGERPINVAFLSGSQKFRVAVSLALGIGQYASRQHRPIESVIIDEGFGCLDSQGRQVMIQELQNLRSQMRCILLVSHQEDFAEAFTDGYQFKLENGATRVTRFQK